MDDMPADFNGGITYLSWLHLGPCGLKHSAINHVTPPAALPTKPGGRASTKAAGGGRAASRAAAQAVGGMLVQGDADHPICVQTTEQQAATGREAQSEELIQIRKQECAIENYMTHLRGRKERRKQLTTLMGLLPVGSPAHTEAKGALIALLQKPAPLPPSFPLALATDVAGSPSMGSGSSSTTGSNDGAASQAGDHGGGEHVMIEVSSGVVTE